MSGLILGDGLSIDLNGTGNPYGTYIGPIATRGRMHTNTINSALTFTEQSFHVCRQRVTQVRVVIPNWAGLGANAGESGSGGGFLLRASISTSTSGPWTQLSFDGVTTTYVGNGATVVSDWATITIESGSTFYIRQYKSGSYFTYCAAADHNMSSMFYPSGGDGVDYSHGDLTGGGTLTNEWVNSSPPLMVLGITSSPSFALIGDSRTFGVYDTMQASGDIGETARSIGQSYAYVNFGTNAQNAAAFTATLAGNRIFYGRYCSHVLCELGGNDVLSGSYTANQTVTNLQTVWALYPNQQIYQTTITPSSTSTNGWINTANQTTSANNSARVSLNTSIRATPSGALGYTDNASALESSLNSGLWIAPSGVAQTSDVVHANNTGYLTLMNSGVINTSVFTLSSAQAALLPQSQ